MDIEKNAPSAVKARWLAGAVFALGMLLSVFAAALVKHDIEAKALRQFAVNFDRIAAKVGERLGTYSLTLRAGAGLFAASGTVDRQMWRNFVRELSIESALPGLQGLGYAQRIAPGGLDAHIAGVRSPGYPGYAVRPAGEREVTTAIVFIEPFLARNLRAFGFDMYSEPVRRDAMIRARDSGEAALSGRVELVQETGRDVQSGVLMYLPVYRRGAGDAPPETLEQRRAALSGWVYGACRMGDLMRGLMMGGGMSAAELSGLRIYDGAKAAPETLMFGVAPAPVEAKTVLSTLTRTIQVSGRTWTLAFDPAAAESALSYAPAWATLITGIVLNILLLGFVSSVLGGRSRAMAIGAALFEQSRDRAEQTEAVFELSVAGLVSFDMARRVKLSNPEFTAQTGLSAESIAGLDEAAFSSRLAQQCLPGARFAGIAALRKRSEEAPDGDGTKVVDPHELIEIAGPSCAMLQVRLREAPAGGVSQIVHIRDVTREMEIDRLKSEFLSTAAHELRTPMASIFGFSELLLADGFSPEEQADFAQTIHRNAKLMTSLINELLDLARIEARRGKDFKFAPLQLQDWVRRVVHDHKPPEGRQGPLLDLPETPLWLNADPSKMEQALGNVISNAYKYSPGGGEVRISITAAQEDRAADAGKIGICVSDQGMGMTAQQVSRACERFYRADTSGKIPGTGLGMSIVSEIVGLHGGRVAISSAPGVGTAVTLWLPTIIATPAGESGGQEQVLQ